MAFSLSSCVCVYNCVFAYLCVFLSFNLFLYFSIFLHPLGISYSVVFFLCESAFSSFFPSLSFLFIPIISSPHPTIAHCLCLSFLLCECEYVCLCVCVCVCVEGGRAPGACVFIKAVLMSLSLFSVNQLIFLSLLPGIYLQWTITQP